jgi:hypothetical protein
MGTADDETFESLDNVPDDALVLQCGDVVDGRTGNVLCRLDRDSDGDGA